jgi:Conserved hypothetical protein 2217 (DUF2460)
MANFPQLKTGAVAQYPSQRQSSYSTGIAQFLDGSEQRFRDAPRALKRWTIRFDQLDEGELATLTEFVRTQEGEYGTFAFADPWDGAVYSNCSFEGGTMERQLMAEGRASTALIVKENRG